MVIKIQIIENSYQVFATTISNQWFITGKTAAKSEFSLKPEGEFSAVEFEKEFEEGSFPRGSFSQRNYSGSSIT